MTKSTDSVWLLLRQAAIVAIALLMIWLAKVFVFGSSEVKLSQDSLFKLEVVALGGLLLVFGWPKLVSMIEMLGGSVPPTPHPLTIRNVLVVLTALGGSLLVIIGAVALLNQINH